jgi:hypothetical protein
LNRCFLKEEEMFNMPDHKGNANQNGTRFFSPELAWLNSKTHAMTNAGMEAYGRCKLAQTLWKSV